MNDTSEMLSAIKQGATLLFTVPMIVFGKPQQVQIDRHGWYYWNKTVNAEFEVAKVPKMEYTSIHVIEQVLEELKDFQCEIL